MAFIRTPHRERQGGRVNFHFQIIQNPPALATAGQHLAHKTVARNS